METTGQTSRAYFWVLTIVHLALIAGQVVFAIIALFLTLNKKIELGDPEFMKTFRYIVPIIAAAGILASLILYVIKVKQINAADSLKMKMTSYRGILIMRYAFLEGPSFLAGFAFMFTSDVIYLGIMLLMILSLVFWRPSRTKIVTDLNLNPQETATLENPDAVISY